MSALLAARTELVTALSADPLLDGVRVVTHGGDFGLEDLQRYAVQAPCLVVAALRFDPTDEGGTIAAETVMGVVAVAKDTPGLRRDAGALTLIDTATRVLMRIGVPATGGSRPRNVIARNLFSTKLDVTGVAMWCLTYTQVVDLQDDVSSYVDLAKVHADYEIEGGPAL